MARVADQLSVGEISRSAVAIGLSPLVRFILCKLSTPEVGFESREARAIRRTNSMTDAACRKARADSIVASKLMSARP